MVRMEKLARRKLTVIRKQQITPNMLRVTLGGDQMEGFPEGREGADFRLIIPTGSEQPIMRTYTILNYHPERQEVDVDFVLHRIRGPASHWARHCEPGEPIGLAGPGQQNLANFKADWFLFAGDMSALPAITANLELLPETARGYAVLEIMNAGDIQQLNFPSAMSVQWVINPHPNTGGHLLYDAVIKLPWQQGRPAIWVAGEGGMIQVLRNYFKQQELATDDIYTCCYWQIGLTEDQVRLGKRQQLED